MDDDPELYTIINVLNNKPIGPKRPRPPYRKPPQRPPNKTAQNSSIRSAPNPRIRRNKILDCSQQFRDPIEIDIFEDIKDYYKEDDEEYKKTLEEKSEKTADWVYSYTKKKGSGTKRTEGKASGGFISKRKYLIFRPYIDPMNMAPPNPVDRGYYYVMLHSDVKLIRYILEDNGFCKLPPRQDNFTILWHGGPAKSNVFQCLTKYQKINRMPKSYEITRKDSMYKNISRMAIQHGKLAFNFVPQTFIMPQEAYDLANEMKGEMWIVKPSSSSQGKGIFLTANFNDIPKGNYVVSRYINNPLLIYGYKFDLRVYVAITCLNPLRIYMYKEGLVRFATQKYSNTGKNNKYKHLTNYSINKNSSNFVENKTAQNDSTGSKWSISAFRKLLKEKKVDDDAIFDKIKDIIIKTILSIEGIMFNSFDQQVPYRNNCFEMLGFDVMIDDALNPALLEVNLSPSLSCDAPLDQKIKGELMSDLFTMIGVVPLDRRVGGEQPKNQKGAFAAYATYFAPAVPRRKATTGSNWNSSTHAESNDGMSREERRIVKESNAENSRCGNFERIFPNELSMSYKSFFEIERPYNTMLWNRLGRVYKKEGHGGLAFTQERPRRHKTSHKIVRSKEHL